RGTLRSVLRNERRRFQLELSQIPRNVRRMNDSCLWEMLVEGGCNPRSTHFFYAFGFFDDIEDPERFICRTPLLLRDTPFGRIVRPVNRLFLGITTWLSL